MKSIIFIILLHLYFFNIQAQVLEIKTSNNLYVDSLQTVDAACGQCMFAMKGKGCNLAVRIEGKTYFVDGSKIDDHGDAHASDGFCNKIRKAKVSGLVINNRFVASSFQLLPEEKIQQ
jgi:hypothetical protein